MKKVISFRISVKKAVCLLLSVTFLLLVSCDSSNYKKAVGLQEKGNYSEAAKLYESLGEYEDSPARLDQCSRMAETVDHLNKNNAVLDQLMQSAGKAIDSKDSALDESLREKLKASVSDAKAAKIVLTEYPKTETETDAFIRAVSDSDYTGIITALQDGTAALETSIRQYALVNAPDEAYVVKCLKKVKGILKVAAVTEDNDPNGNLNKPRFYTAAVYFSHKYVNQNNVFGKTVIDKGTDCGGCVEVYATVEDAARREKYLASFDGTILATGSHKVVGTVVVRTSNEMKASQQKKVEKAVIDELTRIE